MNERLKQLRLTLNLSQEEFGKKIGIESKAHISSLEKGKRNITDRIIKDICREFNVNEPWLRYGNGTMFEELTESQKLMKYTALLLKNTDSKVAQAITNFILTYEELDDTSKKVLERFATKYVENMKKSQS